MNKKTLNFINATTAEWHDDVASINEEFVDGNDKEVLRICKDLTRKIEQFKESFKDEI